MKINVIGKTHMEGTSKKTGKPYNFNVIYYTTQLHGQYSAGFEAHDITIDESKYPFSFWKLEKEYELVYDMVYGKPCLIGVEELK